MTRDIEIRKIVNTLVGTRDSVALVGDHRTGKTTLLGTIAEVLLELHMPVPGPRLVPSCFDLQDRVDWTATTFWEVALRPLNSLDESGSPIPFLLKRARDRGYTSDALAEIVKELYRQRYRLVLFIDEFDTLVQRPHLMTAAFLGGLRSLLSSHADAMALVYAGRCTPSDLNRQTQNLCMGGSPIFNVMRPIFIRPVACERLAPEVGARLSGVDCRWIDGVTGGHAGLAMGLLTQMHAEKIASPLTRENRRMLSDTARRESQAIFDVSWRDWHPQGRLALLRLTLAELSLTVGVPAPRPAFAVPEDGEFRTQLRRLFSKMLGSEALREMIRQVIGLEVLPMGGSLEEWFSVAVNTVMEHNAVERAIRFMLQNRLRWHDDINDFIDRWGVPRDEITAAPPVHISEVDDLVSRGVVCQDKAHEWSLRSRCLFWWLIERVRQGYREDLLSWLRYEHISLDLSPQVYQSLDAHRRLLRPIIERDGIRFVIDRWLDLEERG